MWPSRGGGRRWRRLAGGAVSRYVCGLDSVHPDSC